MNEPLPYPLTPEDYELLCECFGSLTIDELISNQEENNEH